MDLNYLSPEELVDFAHDILDDDAFEKEASELPYGVDLNDFGMDELLDLAEIIEGEMVKEAGRAGNAWKAYKGAITGQERKAAKAEVDALQGRVKSRTARMKKGYKGPKADDHAARAETNLNRVKAALSGEQAAHRSGVRKQVGAIAGTAAGVSAAVGGAGYGVHRMRRKKKGKR